MYAKIIENEQYKRLVEMANKIRSIFDEKDINVTDKREITPHVTVSKLSKGKVIIDIINERIIKITIIFFYYRVLI